MMKKIILSTCAGAALMFGAAAPAFAAGDHLITMQQADIRAFIDDVSIVTGKTFLVDPRVQGKVTISSEQSLSPREVFEVFKDVMRVHGYTVIRTSTGEYRVTLLQGSAQDAPFVNNFGANGQFATTVIRLSHADAAEAAKLIKPVLHSQGIVTANQGGNIIVVTDFPENLKKAREIVAAMDSNGKQMETIQLTNLAPRDVEDALKNLGGQRPKYSIVAIPGTNSLVLEGTPDDLARLKPIINQMDSAGFAPRGAVSVISLRYADGADLIEILTTLLPNYAREGEPVPTVAHEVGSNSIVISASAETQAALEQIIRQLDIRRPQVLVEAIIVEISDTAAKDLGVQFAIGGLDGSFIPFVGTNYSRQAPSALALAGAIAGPQLGLSDAESEAFRDAAVSSILGSNGVVAGGGGIDNDTLFSVIVNALQTDEDSNVLSTPFVTTLDNVPARFVVGQDIPITTGESLGTDNLNPFRTFERMEVGIKLDVLPQISEGDVIRLAIKQEVSSIAGALTTLSSDFITNTREIETTVLANDGEIIVLGGLIQDDEQITADKVPILGDAPVIGNLFRSKSKSRARTNLMVFLRPTIIRDQSDAQPLTQERLDYMRREDRNQSGREIPKMDQFLQKP